jgi:predicted RNA methylase
MILLWIIDIILILIIIFLLLLLSMFWPPDSPWAPWWKTSKDIALAICRLAEIDKDDIVYDLGSGTGTALLVATKEFGVKGVGIEIDPLRSIYSKIRFKIKGLSEKVKIIHKNFHDVNISQASVIFVYLVPKALERLKPKFLKELKKGTKIVSLRYRMTLPLIKKDKQNKLYLYRI